MENRGLMLANKNLFLLFIFLSLSTLAIIVIINLNKEVSCEINGLKIDKSLIGMERNKVFTYLGNPKNSAIEIKGFDEFVFKIDKKEFTIVVHYKNSGENYYVSSHKCIRSHPSLEIHNYILWH